MGKDKDYIDKLYSDKLSKFESNISAEDWTKLSTKLSRVNFFKFSLTSFNAYFLSAIVSFAAAAAYFGTNNLNLSEKIELLENKIELLQELQQKQQDKNESLPLDTFKVEEPIIVEKVETKNEENITSPPKKEIIETEQQSEKLKIDSTAIKKDSLVATKSDTSTIKPKKNIRRIKKQVIIKQDKVVIKDTVVIKKKTE